MAARPVPATGPVPSPSSGSVEAGGAAGGLGLGDVVKGLDVAKQILPAPSDAPPGIESAVRNAGGPDTGADALNASELTKIQGRGLLNAPPPVADPTTTMASTSTPLVPPPPAPGTSAAPGTSGGFNSGQDLIGANGSVTVPPVPRRSDLTFDQHRRMEIEQIELLGIGGNLASQLLRLEHRLAIEMQNRLLRIHQRLVEYHHATLGGVNALLKWTFS
jgi:hypothetical protein